MKKSKLKTNRRIVYFLMLLGALVGVSPMAHGQSFTIIDAPGASSTTATGMNDSGQVVVNAPNGFLDAGGSFSPINVSGSTFTFANGISGTGVIVGSYRFGLGTTQHGFTYTQGTFSNVDFPGADDTSANAISSDGTYIVGWYITGPSSGPNPYHGFIFHNGTINGFDAPPCTGGADRTSANGVNNSGQVVGSCNSTFGFLYSGGVFSTISVPGALQTVPLGINNSGDVSGYYVDATGQHGFILRAGTYFPINAANSTQTQVNGVNNSGDCVGSFTDTSGKTHGFMETGLTGYVDPKYVVLGVTYAPPGPSGSTFVQYLNSQEVGNTLTLIQSFENKSSFGVSDTFELGIPLVSDGEVSATFSTQVGQTITNTSSTTNTSTITTSMQVQQGEKTFGTGSFFAPVNHDYDVIWIWLNPAAIFSFYDYGSWVWRGYGFDGNDQPGMDIVGIQLGYLNGDFGPIPAQFQMSLDRAWAATQVWPTGQGPALTSADLAQIASFDPFSDPSYGPKFFGADPPSPGTSDGRFTVSSCSASASFPYNQAPPSGAANIYTCTLTYTNSSTQEHQVSTSYSQTYSVDQSVSLKGSYQKFVASFTAKLSDSTTLSWTTTQRNSTTTKSTSTASLSVQGPPCGNAVPGVGPCIPVYDASGDEPTQFLVYQDNLYGTFEFAPIGYYSSNPTASLSATSLTFPSEPAQTTSPAQAVTLVNRGSAALSISVIATTGDFSETNNCGGSVAAGAKCTIDVTFTPTASGARNGTLTVTDNNNGVAGSTQTVVLSGVGSGTEVSLSSQLTFSPQLVSTISNAQTVTLTNTGNASLTLTRVLITGPFAVVPSGTTCSASSGVPAGATCTVAVIFTPTVAGKAAGTLSFSDNAFGSPQSVSLSGTGQDYSFGPASGSSTSANVAAGQTATYNLTADGEAGLSGTVNFTCTGAPSNATCSVSPNPATLGSSSTSVTVTVTTVAQSVSLPNSRPGFPIAPISATIEGFLLLTLVLSWIPFIIGHRNYPGGLRRAPQITMLAIAVLLVVVGLAGCGGGSSPTGPALNPGTAAGTYTLTVTGTVSSGSSTASHTVKLTLTVT